MTNGLPSEMRTALDNAVVELLVPLRMKKEIGGASLENMSRVLDDISVYLANENLVPKELVGELWFVFTSMLSEAEHAQFPDPIIDAAWFIGEKLRVIFGPHF